MDIQGVVAILERVSKAENFNWSSTSTRDQRNAQFNRCIGIVHHGHAGYNPTPDPRWYCKRAAGRPQSDDVCVLVEGGRKTMYDIIPNAGADGYSFNYGAHGEPFPSDQELITPDVPHDRGQIGGGGGGQGQPPAPVNSLYWTAEHDAIVQKLRAQGITEAPQVARQLAYSFPAEPWGGKSAGGGRPISRDTVGLRLDSGKLIAIKLTSPVTIYDNLGPEHQWHYVMPTSYLPSPPPKPEPTPEPAPVPSPTPGPSPEFEALVREALAEILTRLDRQELKIDNVVTAVSGVQTKVDAFKFPKFKARLFNQDVTFDPQG